MSSRTHLANSKHVDAKTSKRVDKLVLKLARKLKSKFTSKNIATNRQDKFAINNESTASFTMFGNVNEYDDDEQTACTCYEGWNTHHTCSQCLREYATKRANFRCSSGGHSKRYHAYNKLAYDSDLDQNSNTPSKRNLQLERNSNFRSNPFDNYNTDDSDDSDDSDYNSEDDSDSDSDDNDDDDCNMYFPVHDDYVSFRDEKSKKKKLVNTTNIIKMTNVTNNTDGQLILVKLKMCTDVKHIIEADTLGVLTNLKFSHSKDKTLNRYKRRVNKIYELYCKGFAEYGVNNFTIEDGRIIIINNEIIEKNKMKLIMQNQNKKIDEIQIDNPYQLISDEQ